MPGIGPGSRSGKTCTDHLGQTFKSESEMCRHWGISQASFTHRIKRKWPLEKALTHPQLRGRGTPCTDHLGNQYPSASEMFKAYNTNYTVYNYRMKVMGWTQEQALTTPISNPDLAGAHTCTDHLGNIFPSKKAMCDHWHVPRNVYFARKRAGKSLKECLDPVTHTKPTQSTPMIDHEGRGFVNLDAMCAYWNISKSDYIQNIRNGLDIKRALTERTTRPKHPKDHLGKKYPSINAMCRAWGITKTTLRARLELGWTLEEILTNPENNSHLIKCRDHIGNEFPSQNAMLAHWGVSYVTYKHRLKHGFDLEHALSPSSLHASPSTDHENRTFPCLAAMLQYWLCQAATFYHRRNTLKWTLEKALTEHTGPATFPYGPVLDKTLKDGWILVSTETGQYVFDTPGVFRLARERAMCAKIANQELPNGMRAKYVKPGWFQVWNTAQTGPAPGLLLNPDDAWLELCLTRYGQTKTRKTGD